MEWSGFWFPLLTDCRVLLCPEFREHPGTVPKTRATLSWACSRGGTDEKHRYAIKSYYRAFTFQKMLLEHLLCAEQGAGHWRGHSGPNRWNPLFESFQLKFLLGSVPSTEVSSKQECISLRAGVVSAPPRYCPSSCLWGPVQAPVTRPRAFSSPCTEGPQLPGGLMGPAVSRDVLKLEDEHPGILAFGWDNREAALMQQPGGPQWYGDHFSTVGAAR